MVIIFEPQLPLMSLAKKNYIGLAIIINFLTIYDNSKFGRRSLFIKGLFKWFGVVNRKLLLSRGGDEKKDNCNDFLIYLSVVRTNIDAATISEIICEFK